MKPYNNSQIYELNFTLVRWNGDDFCYLYGEKIVVTGCVHVFLCLFF